MRHEAGIFAVIETKSRKIAAIAVPLMQPCLVAGKAGVDGIAAQMHDARLGQKQRDKAQELEIMRQLVDDTARIRRKKFEKRDILLTELRDLGHRLRIDGRQEWAACIVVVKYLADLP